MDTMAEPEAMKSSRTSVACLSNMPQEIKNLIMSFLHPRSIPSMVLVNRDFNAALSTEIDQDCLLARILKRYWLENWIIQLPGVFQDLVVKLETPSSHHLIRIRGVSLIFLHLAMSHCNAAKRSNMRSYLRNGYSEDKGWDQRVFKKLFYLMVLEDQIATPTLKATHDIYHAMSCAGEDLIEKGNLYQGLLIHWRATVGGELVKTTKEHDLILDHPLDLDEEVGAVAMKVVFIENLPVEDLKIYLDILCRLTYVIRARLDLPQCACAEGACPSPGPAGRSANEKCQDRAIMTLLLNSSVDEVTYLVREALEALQLQLAKYISSRFQEDLNSVHGNSTTGPCTCLSGQDTRDSGLRLMLMNTVLAAEEKVRRVGQGEIAVVAV